VDAGEARRHSGFIYPPVFRPYRNGRMGDRLRPALRRGPLPNAGLRNSPHSGEFPGMVGGTGAIPRDLADLVPSGVSELPEHLLLARRFYHLSAITAPVNDLPRRCRDARQEVRSAPEAISGLREYARMIAIVSTRARTCRMPISGR